MPSPNLNLAHLSIRVAQSGQDGLLTVVSLLFLIVFSLKAALFLSIGCLVLTVPSYRNSTMLPPY